ncbi:MAG: glycosyltransferase family 4 protein [Roseiflexus sp.]|jgi:glycosyltransferase involved in cell wall biosynthesis|uniref:glycosyltransferase family 4 protein n=1 Tax=Roseiflexus sp. TaxID=2562120 RepID=UPI0025F61ED6|nr:glycosyltransferase family 4 protein [Roseiflexus sp.]MCL6540663.1 glycosyltransferase family 4 protein [Roseiflexus sp.]
MRIALYNLTTTTKFGGVESFVWDLGRELARRGHAVTIIGGVGKRRELAPGVRVLMFPFIERYRFQALPLLRRAYAEAKLLERLSLAIAALPELIAGGYDIIHIQKPYDLGPALLARRFGGARVVLGCHGEDFYPGDTLLAPRIDAAVSCSRFNARTVAARYGFEPTVVFNGIDTNLFRPTAPDPNIVRTDGTPLLLWVGRLQPWKGVDIALRALQEIPRAHLMIVGDGETRADLERLAQELGLAERVRFLGALPRERLPSIYAAADLLLATSFASETFGIGLVEAQACGLPVVASRFGGFPEVIDEGHTGLLVPPRDPTALAAAVRTLLNDPERRRAMAAAAPGWAAQFSWSAVVDRIEAVYDATVRAAHRHVCVF